tara:strand:+ start:40 stop:498 length:459 start_codon:yes stop_codon:yes gene_type:complete
VSITTELITSLLLWISLNSGYILPKEAPEIVPVSHDALSQMACIDDCPVLGFYPDSKYVNPFIADGVSKIYLDQRMKPDEDVCATSILLHELVHYVQEKNDAFQEISDPKLRYVSEEIEAHQLQSQYLYQRFEKGGAGVKVIFRGSKLTLIC